MGERGAAGFPLGEADAEEVFQFLDPGRERRLGDMAGLGGTGEGAGFAERDEELKLAQGREGH